MPQIDKEQPRSEFSPEALGYQEVPVYKRKTFQILSSMVVIGGAFGAGMLSNSGDTAPANIEEAAEDDETATSTTDGAGEAREDSEDDGVRTASDYAEAWRQRQEGELDSSQSDPSTQEREDSTESNMVGIELDPEDIPIPMDAATPSKLLEQYEHNFRCALNAPTIDAQDECLRYLHGDNGGNLYQVNKQLALDFHVYRQEVDPEHMSQATVVEIVDSSTPIGESFSGNEYEVAFIVRQRDETAEGVFQRLVFRRGTLTITETQQDELDIDVNQKPVWLFVSRQKSEDTATIEIN